MSERGPVDVPAPEPERAELATLRARFEGGFARCARSVRRRLAGRLALGGAALGALVAAGASGLAWWTRHGGLRLACVGLPWLGALAALVVARRRRWSDEDVALYLDRALGSHEAVVTALEVRASDGRATPSILRVAVAALGRELPDAARPRWLRAWHAVGLVGLSVAAWFTGLALPPAPAAAAPPPGLETVALEDLEGLEEAKALAKLEARDAAQRARLDALADRARKLDLALEQGLPRREAQAEVSKLREDVAAERRRVGTGEQRRGLEAALGKLAKNQDMERARRALGERDFPQLDEEMDRLANRLEEDARRRARESLAEAAEAARREGAEDVARALEEQQERLGRQGAGADALRELAEALEGSLSEAGKDALRELKESGSAEGRDALSRELAKVLETLDEDDRKRLAEKLAKQAEALRQGGMSPMSADALEELRRQLETPEGRARLGERVREFARQPPASGEAQREGALDGTEQRLGEGETQLQPPMPLPFASRPDAGGFASERATRVGRDGASAKGNTPGSGSGDGRGKPSRGGGPGEHGGTTAKVDGDGVRARAAAKLNPGHAMPDVGTGRTAGRAGETARTGGTGRLGAVGPGEISDVRRGDIPEEYREQVGRYFPAR
ncbi:MAG: hypothetical protein FJ096_08035 [Deltaproteobacteria bacterium]|nr:hypothetical protein [Deltaproteobacteria bacterium]